jgi:hypothetical protein
MIMIMIIIMIIIMMIIIIIIVIIIIIIFIFIFIIITGRKFKDGNMLALAAEAMVNTRQWNYYQPDGELYPEAKEAEQYVQEALALDPTNALAHHLHIHLSEGSNPTKCALPL